MLKREIESFLIENLGPISKIGRPEQIIQELGKKSYKAIPSVLIRAIIVATSSSDVER